MPISKKVRFEIFKRDGFQCQYCGKTPPEIVLEVDHIQPRKRKGKDNEENLITACFDCNRGKGCRDLKIAPDSIVRKKEILKERALQLTGLYKLQEKIQSSIQENIIKLSIKWERLSQNEKELTDHGKMQLKNLLRKFTAYEIDEAMEISWGKPYVESDEKFSYMCGVLYTKKRQREEQGE